MRYQLSQVFPCRFASTYTAMNGERQHATWWMWRHHIWRHRIEVV